MKVNHDQAAPLLNSKLFVMDLSMYARQDCTPHHGSWLRISQEIALVIALWKRKTLGSLEIAGIVALLPGSQVLWILAKTHQHLPLPCGHNHMPESHPKDPHNQLCFCTWVYPPMLMMKPTKPTYNFRNPLVSNKSWEMNL
jgi:hypothetical protein